MGGSLKESDVRAFVDAQNAVGLDSKNDVQTSSKVALTGLPGLGMQAIVFGAGGHAKSILQPIREAGYSISGVVDSIRPKGSLFQGIYPVLGTADDLESIRGTGIAIAFIGVGGATGNTPRATIFRQLKEAGFILPPLISKMANYDLSAYLGEAAYIFPGATVGADCKVGSNVIVNQGAIICDDCCIGEHVHVALGYILAGTVKVGSASTIGMGATIMNNVTLGERFSSITRWQLCRTFLQARLLLCKVYWIQTDVR